MIINPSKDPNQPQTRVESIAALVDRCKQAAYRMSPSNPHREVMIDCVSCIQQLCQRLKEAGAPVDFSDEEVAAATKAAAAAGGN